jgi:hypothetical protein
MYAHIRNEEANFGCKIANQSNIIVGYFSLIKYFYVEGLLRQRKQSYDKCLWSMYYQNWKLQWSYVSSSSTSGKTWTLKCIKHRVWHEYHFKCVEKEDGIKEVTINSFHGKDG